MDASIVEYFAEHEGYKCGYCKGQDTNYSHGMWGHILTATDYEGLLNRGFRRSGKYLYKPTNHMTCCPSYTINLHALDFQLTKSKKKIIKKVNRFLITGENPKLRQDQGCEGSKDVVDRDKGHTSKDNDDDEDAVDSAGDVKEEVNYKEAKDIEMDLADLAPNADDNNSQNQRARKRQSTDQFDSSTSLLNNNSETGDKVSAKAELSQSTSSHKSPQKKAKQMRIERKRAKLIAQGKLNKDEPMQLVKPAPSNKCEKTMEMWLDPTNSGTIAVKKKLTLKLVPTKSPEFESVFKLELEVYQKYQMTIHNDTPDECTEKQFRRFLCDTPLDRETGGFLQGSFHQQYWLDSELIAVGVIDILPHIVSSVYFFYDPAYTFLSLGNYGALREIAFTKELNKSQPDVEFYYMGYYIHSCKKMKYKGGYSPSYLLCPERFTWVELDDELRNRLDQQKYQRLDRKPPCNEELPEPRQHDIQKVQIFFRQCILPYPIYELKRGSSDREQIQQYCDLVGEEVASEMLLYRS